MAKKKEREVQRYFCRDCKHAFGYHEKSIKGDYFMAKCPFRKWSVFLNHTYCDKLELKNG